LQDWARDEPEGNIALRLPARVVGIDVDTYGAKTGAQTLVEAEKHWRRLPLTAISTSRDDAVPGIRLFRVPPDVELEGVIRFDEYGIGDIEICQHHHRYVVCWPSWHPEGAQYRWFGPDGGEMAPDDLPAPHELSDLPENWLKALKKNRSAELGK
jgi:hypothetical protein